MRNTLLLLILPLSGCSLNTSDEGRGSIYKTPLVEFTCSHEPSKTDIKIDKEILTQLATVLPLLKENKDSLTPFINTEGFPKVKELVTLCQQLIAGETIE